ncbi:HD domain-containing protein [Paenibacillus hemerocallicola]|uniref:HD domain-containing protein n=1 Tax=Paenibacillus hemerocallicola TaxID=1172614 RepID=A0A5C4T4I4_9BACL|nr:HD domain-containing phosphohydrolase [Paenibacillus hemerocallicola]TNJ63943.1 HD domain-containing protein [Paenibacillus hemerocallicola]
MNESLRLFLTLSDAVIITDSSHYIVDVNSAYEHITGYRRDTILGAKASVVKSKYTNKATYKSMHEALDKGESWSGIFINKKSNGELWHSSISITPYTFDGSCYYVGIFRELEHLEEGIYIAEDRRNNIQGVLLKVLAISCEIRDPAIEDHLTRVQQYSESLLNRHNERMKSKLSDDYIQSVIHSSIMHDIGKSGVPEGILYKPGPLTSYERLIVEMHPLIGVDILEKINSELQDSFFKDQLSVARNIILHHHEKWDGTGYPSKLQGTDIPLEARVVSIVDVYDALTSRRPYKEIWPSEKALSFLRDHRGTSFDPDLIDSFVSLHT